MDISFLGTAVAIALYTFSFLCVVAWLVWQLTEKENKLKKLKQILAMKNKGGEKC